MTTRAARQALRETEVRLPPIDGDWRLSAACRGFNDNTMFPPPLPQRRAESTRHREMRLHSEATAKRVCARCPARETCLEEAMRDPRLAVGVWGGLAEHERAALARQRRKAGTA